MGSLFGGGGGGSTTYVPATYGQGGNPAAYVPQNPAGADLNYQSLVNSLMGQYTGGNTAPQVNYPLYESLATNLLGSPYFGSALGASQMIGPQEQALGQQAIGQANQFAGLPQQDVALGQGLESLASQWMSPPSASPLYQQQANLTGQQAAAANAASGVQGPYAAGNINNALNQLNLGWQAQAPQVGGALAGQAANLFGAAPGLAGNILGLGTQGAQAGMTGAAAPLNLQSGFYGNVGNLLSGATGIGQQQYTLPQQVLGDLAQYLQLQGTGSGLAAAEGGQGFNQAQTQLGNIGSLISGGLGYGPLGSALYGNNALQPFGSGGLVGSFGGGVVDPATYGGLVDFSGAVGGDAATTAAGGSGILGLLGGLF